METNKRTITLPANVRLREAGDGGDSRTVEGYALKFGVRSVVMGYYYPEQEILEPGCIDDAMLREQRIYFTMFHDRQIILGRWDKGEGTLNLSIDETGLKVACELPNTPDGDTALELIKRGDLSEMSFVYSTNEDDSENCVSYEETDEKTPEGRTIYLRHVKKILHMYDVTVAATPAYEDTEIKARESRLKAFVEAKVEEPTEEETHTDEAAARELAARRREAKRLRAIASALT